MDTTFIADRIEDLTASLRSEDPLAEGLDALAVLAAIRDLVNDEIHVRVVEAADRVSANRLSKAAGVSNSTASRWIAADRRDLP